MVISILNAVWDPFVITLTVLGGVLLGLGLRGRARFLIQQRCARCRQPIGDAPGAVARSCSECGASLEARDGALLFERKRFPLLILLGCVPTGLALLCILVVEPLLQRALTPPAGGPLTASTDALIECVRAPIAPGRFGHPVASAFDAATDLYQRLFEERLSPAEAKAWFAATAERHRRSARPPSLFPGESRALQLARSSGLIGDAEVLDLAAALVPPDPPPFPPVLRAGSRWRVPVLRPRSIDDYTRVATTLEIALVPARPGEPVRVLERRTARGALPIEIGVDVTDSAVVDMPADAAGFTGTLRVTSLVDHSILGQYVVAERRVVEQPCSIVDEAAPIATPRVTGESARRAATSRLALRAVTVDRSGRVGELALRLDGGIAWPDPDAGVALAFETLVRIDGAWMPVGHAYAYRDAGSDGQREWSTAALALPEATALGATIDVLFRPSDRVIAGEPSVRAIVGEEILLRDVPIERGPSVTERAAADARAEERR